MSASSRPVEVELAKLTDEQLLMALADTLAQLRLCSARSTFGIELTLQRQTLESVLRHRTLNRYKRGARS